MADALIITIARAGTPEAATADYVCDGVNDDIEINAALAAAGAAGGGIVRLAAGDYWTGQSIVIHDDNVSIEGDPAGGTAIRPEPDTWVSLTSPEGVELTACINFVGVDNFAARFLTIESVYNPGGLPERVHLAFNGIQAIPTGPATGENCTNGVFEGNTIRLAQAHTYSLWSVRTDGLRIIDNLIEGGAAVGNSHTSQEGIEIFGGSNMLISGNVITGMGNAAIQIGGLADLSSDASVDSITVTGNHISNCRVGVFIGTTFSATNGAASATNILIEDNRFDALYEAGLMIRNWTGNAATPPELSNIVFRDNEVNLLYSEASGFTPAGLWLYNLEAPGSTIIEDVLVENNNFSTTQVADVPAGFWLAPGYHGLMIVQNFAGTTIQGNVLSLAQSSDESRGISVLDSSGIAILGNEISGAGLYSIELVGSRDFIIDANTIANWGQGAGGPAIIAGGASAYSITGNVLQGPNGDGTNFITIYDSGAATSLSDNVRIADQDATLAGSVIQVLQLIGAAAAGTGNALDNIIIGNDQDNLLDGGAGADLLDGGLGNDQLSGGSGDDRYLVDSALDLVAELAGEGDDLVTASVDYQISAQVERLVLSGAALAGTGNSQANVITGNGLANVLDGGAGADQLIGGLGDDHYLVDSASDVVVELDGGGDDLVTAAADHVLSDHVERLVLTGTALAGTGNDLANLITGNGLANLLDGAAGDDLLDGSAGDDRMTGGLGNDQFLVDSMLDLVIERDGEGDDLVVASADYALSDHVERLTLTGAAVAGAGNALANTITGNALANLLDGGTGADRLIGGFGDDHYVVDGALDLVTELEGEGDDLVSASADHVLGAHFERLTLTGTALAGTGNALDNALVGNALGNILDGAAGADLLDGGAGDDRLIGGLGDDHFLVDSALDIVTELDGEGDDLVTASVDYALGAHVERLTLTGAALAGTGNGLANIMTGNALDNLLDGGAGADQLAGGLGNDRYVVDSALDAVTELEGEGDDLVTASADHVLGAHVERLTLAGTALAGTGNALANTIIGNELANLLEGAAGDDLLDGGLGADRMTGGLGNDSFLVDDANDVAIELDGEGDDLVTAAFDYRIGDHVERLTLAGAALIGTGNASANVITGNQHANILDGGAGNDSIDGGGGDDEMIGGLGDDRYVVDSALDIVTERANEGDDLVTASIDHELADHVERLVLVGSALHGTGNALANVITGNALANQLDGGAGNDQLIGGSGNDEYLVDSSLDIVTELQSEGDDLVLASADYQLSDQVERLVLTGAALAGTGNALANAITGNELANLLDGGAGDDLLDGGTGADRLTGGTGDDWFIVDSALDQVVEVAGGGTDTIFAQVNYTLGAAALVERLYAADVTGRAALVLYGNGGVNEIRGNAGNNLLHGAGGAGDVLIGLGGDDLYYTDVAGTQIVEAIGGGSDALYTSVSFTLAAAAEVETLSVNSYAATSAITLIGNSFANRLVGNAGANILHGGGGAGDVLAGQNGNDTYYTDVSSTQIIEELAGGTDALYASVSYVLGKGVSVEILSSNAHASTSALNLTGNAFAQIVAGNAGNNLLHGGGGLDTLYGFGGNDTYWTDVAGVVVVEEQGGGNDALYTSVSYVLGASASVETLSTNSTAATDAIDLAGNSFANVLAGNAGANLLDGRSGNDTLHGFGGADSFAFTTALGAGNVDVVADFQRGIDKITLDDAIFTGLGLGALAGSAFATGSGAPNALVRIIYDNQTGALLFDADGQGGGGAVQFAWVGAGLNLAASDFVVI